MPSRHRYRLIGSEDSRTRNPAAADRVANPGIVIFHTAYTAQCGNAAEEFRIDIYLVYVLQIFTGEHIGCGKLYSFFCVSRLLPGFTVGRDMDMQVN